MQNLFYLSFYVLYFIDSLLTYIRISAKVGGKEYIWQKEKKNTEKYSYYSTELNSQVGVRS